MDWPTVGSVEDTAELKRILDAALEEREQLRVEVARLLGLLRTVTAERDVLRADLQWRADLKWPPGRDA